jgi:hypothetical protein
MIREIGITGDALLVSCKLLTKSRLTETAIADPPVPSELPIRTID